MPDPIIAPERLSHIIGLIYDCAVDVGRWPIAMEAIRQELGCHNATLDLLQLPSGESLTSATCGIPPTYLPLLAYAGPDTVDQWGGEERLRSLPLDEPAIMSRTNPDFAAMTTRNRYFLDFAQPQGLVDVIALGLARDGRGVGALAFGRHRDRGAISEREIEVARLLLPHVQRAAAINRIIDRETGLRQTFAATLDALSAPVGIAGLNRRLVHANPAFTRILSQGGPLHIGAGLLGCRDAGNARQLAQALDAIKRGELPPRGVSIVAGRDDDSGTFSVIPISADAAAIFVAAPLVRPIDAAALVGQRYGLTVQETRVFAQLVAGRSQAAAAERLGIGLTTLKTHRSRIYNKLAIRSHAELMAVATTLSIPLAG